MATITVTKTYSDGSILTEADLDGIKTSIETFLNTTKINDDNIQTNGILPNKINIPDSTPLELGTGNDATFQVISDNLEVENVTTDKDIIFKCNDGGTEQTMLTLDGDVPEVVLGSGVELNANSNKVTSLAAPTADNDAARKKYVDDQITSATAQPTDEIVVHTGNGHGSTDTNIRRFTTKSTDTGTAITHATTAANGDTFTINEAGIYAIMYVDGRGAAVGGIGLTKNSANLTTAIASIAFPGEALAFSNTISGFSNTLTWIGPLASSDVIRAHTDGSVDNTSALDSNFQIRKISV